MIKFIIKCFATFIVLCVVSPLNLFGADVNLSWTPNTEPDIFFYRMYYGTSSRNYGMPISTGSTISSYTVTDLDSDKTYYFSVTAVDINGNESGFSTEISTFVAGDTSPPDQTAPPVSDDFISNLAVASGKTYEVVSGLSDGLLCYIDRSYTFSNVPESLLNLVYIKTANNDNGYKNNDAFLTFDVNRSVIVYIAHDDRSFPSWLNGFKNTGMSLKTDKQMSIYSKEYPAGRVELGSNDYGSMYSVIIKEAVSTPDTISPELTIQTPTTGNRYTTQESTISLTGTASDNTGVSEVRYSVSSGGSGLAQGTDEWSISTINLVEGSNIVKITALDSAGNQNEKEITIVYEPADVLSPSITITTENNSETDQPYISISGTAVDNAALSRIEWNSSEGGSGVANGLENWSIEDISLSEGDNTIKITAVDKSGNVSSSIFNIVYAASAPPASDVFISNIVAASGRSYEVVSGLSDGLLCYIDRSYTFSNVPESLLNLVYIKTANNDNGYKNNDAFLTFDVNRSVIVYIAHDDRSFPSWLNGFKNTGMSLKTDKQMSIYSKEYPAGQVILASNDYGSMYSVIIK